ncbi:MAG: hypothetical protein MK209_02365 [Planctomycetes bacterium]|nr:hypothetical protein [Planctomycetota bacterium]
MLLFLFLQAALFLPAPAPVSGAPDQEYQRQLLTIDLKPSLSGDQLAALRPNSRSEIAAATTLAMGTESQARLAALILAGTKDDGAARALYRAGCQATSNNTAVACLLAPASLPAGVAPALAYLAQDPSKALPVRATAMARLLEHGRSGAWPLARALFQGGTRAAADRPLYADWQQSPRWELSKRTVLISLNLWLETQGFPPSPIEPNAAWEEQLRQLEATEQLIAAAAALTMRSKPLYGAERLERTQTLLLTDAAIAGDTVAARALPWLLPQARSTLRELSQQDDQERAELAARVLTEAPR